MGRWKTSKGSLLRRRRDVPKREVPQVVVVASVGMHPGGVVVCVCVGFVTFKSVRLTVTERIKTSPSYYKEVGLSLKDVVFLKF